MTKPTRPKNVKMVTVGVRLPEPMVDRIMAYAGKVYPEVSEHGRRTMAVRKLLEIALTGAEV